MRIKGNAITLVSYSYMLIETLKAANILKQHDIMCEVIDLSTLRPLNLKKIVTSIKKTKSFLFIDNGYSEFGIGSEVVSKLFNIISNKKGYIIDKMGLPSYPIPSTRKLAALCYPTYKDIVNRILKITKSKKKISIKEKVIMESDIPNLNFKGPF